MHEIIDLTGITFPWWIPLTIIGVALAAGIGLCFVDGGLGAAIIVLTVILGGLIGLFTIPDPTVRGEERTRTTTQLYELGYENVSVRQKTFTASKDGKYVEGSLIPTKEPYIYYVVETPTE